MFKLHVALKAKFRSGTLEFSDGNGIVECIVEPAKTTWLRGNAKTGREKLEIVARPRPKHHAVLSESYRFAIAIRRDMAYGEQRN